MLTRARLVVLALAALALAACGSIHPGDAAVVDGTAISMKTFDTNARLYCELSLRGAAQQGVQSPSVPNEEVRRHAISDLVTVIVARDLAKQKGVTPDVKSYKRSSAEIKAIAEVFPRGDDAKTVTTILENDAEISAIAIALAEQSTGLTLTDDNQQQLFTTGREMIDKAFKDHDVKLAPRFGLSGTLKDLAPTGSVSVSEVGFDAPTDEELPPEQRCA
ncbi:hypothetical protein GCM10022234_07590 [Aeromicrobium panaciterrae]|uniref:hypothetical protein n=1 Tax=Aeromicrobium panaciterrae TaxID=363861 RepID=UPI0031D163F6